MDPEFDGEHWIEANGDAPAVLAVGGALVAMELQCALKIVSAQNLYHQVFAVDLECCERTAYVVEVLA